VRAGGADGGERGQNRLASVSAGGERGRFIPASFIMSKASLVARFKQIFGRPPALVTRAPGRIEFIGNHTDYNGGTVLGA
jgi:hypothetical protein